MEDSDVRDYLGRPSNAIELIHDSRRNTVSTFNIGHKTLSPDSQDEIDENQDAEPEKINNDELNKTLGDIITKQLFGVKDPNEKPYEMKEGAQFFERIFHPMNYGSMRGSIFALSSMCLEAGTLVLAIRCEQFGMVNYLLAIILGGIIAYSTLVMMAETGKRLNKLDYSKVVNEVLGKKAGVFMDCNLSLYLFGALISFQVFIYQILGSVTYDIMKIFDKIDTKMYPTFEIFKEEYWRTNNLIKFPIMFGVICLVFPLCLLKDVSKMRYASLFGVLALIYSIVVIVIESVFFLIYKNNDIISKMNWFNISKAFSYKEGYPFFGGLATVFYIYSCHAGAFPVYKTLQKHTTRRIRKVYRRSILLDIIIYFSVAAASFITAPENPPELILYRENLDGFNPDYFVIVAKVGIILNLFFSTPANYAGLRISLFELIWGNSNITNCKNIFVTLITLSIVTLIGALYDKILDYIELLGGFCSVIYCFLIPGLIYVKSDPSPISFRNILIIFMISSLTVIGYTSGIMTILFNMVKING
jgi:amino acid permease